jgi:hypothetical protein
VSPLELSLNVFESVLQHTRGTLPFPASYLIYLHVQSDILSSITALYLSGMLPLVSAHNILPLCIVLWGLSGASRLGKAEF